MPKVGGKHFPYTKKGKKAAAKARKSRRSGSNHNEEGSTYYGGLKAKIV